MPTKGEEKSQKSIVIAKTPSELQKMRLDKLMKNPTKSIVIPEKSKDWNPRGPQEFIRNVWGSSAGAGSGDFHVYRGVRRREYARQKFITEKAKKTELNTDFDKKVHENKRIAEERTAKKRAKRLKRKSKAKRPKKEEKKEESEESEEESDEEKPNEEREDNSDLKVNNKEASPVDGDTST